LHLIDHVDETLRRRPGPLPGHAFSWWPDWVRRSGDALLALVATVADGRRAWASRQQLLRELGHLDDRMLLDIGVQPSALRRAPRVELRLWLPVPWR
jgi:uncharacterized protein YjiS (DUF1127 family)